MIDQQFGSRGRWAVSLRRFATTLLPVYSTARASHLFARAFETLREDVIRVGHASNTYEDVIASAHASCHLGGRLPPGGWR